LRLGGIFCFDNYRERKRDRDKEERERRLEVVEIRKVEIDIEVYFINSFLVINAPLFIR
jgi:hypothetical protein